MPYGLARETIARIHDVLAAHPGVMPLSFHAVGVDRALLVDWRA